LETKEILLVADIIRVAREIRNFLKVRLEKYPELSTEILNIFDNPNLQKIIFRMIDENGGIRDNATKELQRIRIEINEKSNRLRSKINKMAKQFNEENLMQENFFTINDGRFVLPIKSEHKRHIPGIIHGISQTGSTVYIEPSEIIEMNNEISLLKSEEQREIYNILRKLTSEIAKDSAQLIETYDILGHIDAIFAKANYALQFGGIKPEILINSDEKINEKVNKIDKNLQNVKNEIKKNEAGKNESILRNVYHPLLVQNKGKKNVIPLSANFNFEKRGYLISGPNAGGKTVALKNIGLNILLALSGFFPIGEVKTSFLNVFSAIGDHQSIENDLSTFSSQIQQMKEILDVSDANSLVLIDEICSGTDPQEGSALASGILDTFIELNLFFIVTTHQSSLKTYALNSKSADFYQNYFQNNIKKAANKEEKLNENSEKESKKAGVIENASFEFDEKILKPTYNFLAGIPGNSYAFFLAKNVGLSKKVVERSKKYLGNRQKELEKSIATLQNFKQETEEIIKEARSEKLKYEGMKKDYENRKSEFIDKKKQLIEDAKVEANAILQKANALIENTIKEIREEKRSIAEVKNEFAKQQKELENEVAKIKIKQKNPIENIEFATELFPNDAVGMLESAEIGIVIEADNIAKTALVEFNGMKFRLPFSQLYMKERPKNLVKKTIIPLNLNVKTRLDLRGFRAEAALQEVENFIAEAIMGNADYITIIHGKGTGALRVAIHQELKHLSGVKNFRLGEIVEGGSGVTIAYLK
jgi:DNA mismatch repair protein MutS2